MTNASRTMLMDLATLDWDPELLAAMRRPGGDAAGDPLLGRGLRRPPTGCSPGCRWPARSATSRPPCSGRPASSPARRSAPTAPAASCCSTPAPARSPPGTACSPRSRYRIDGHPPVVRPGGRDRGHRLAGAVAAGQPGPDLHRRRGRGAGPHRRRQRRLLHRAGLLRAVRAALAQRRPGRDRRADRLHHQGAPGPGGAGGVRLADPRGGRRDERRLRRGAAPAAGRRRDDRATRC